MCVIYHIFMVELLTKKGIEMKQRTVTPFAVQYGEFPELLFGKSTNGNLYFDATAYIEQKGDSRKHSPIDFVRKFSFWVETFKRYYEISDNEMLITDENSGHILIEECLALLFVTYIDPAFGAYMIDRISELLLDGIVISDTRIIAMARNRLTKESLTNLIDEK